VREFLTGNRPIFIVEILHFHALIACFKQLFTRLHKNRYSSAEYDMQRLQKYNVCNEYNAVEGCMVAQFVPPMHD
jgi:hypothetical protein